MTEVRDAVEVALRAEFQGWIAEHPAAAFFDWRVATDNVMAAAAKAALAPAGGGDDAD